MANDHALYFAPKVLLEQADGVNPGGRWRSILFGCTCCQAVFVFVHSQKSMSPKIFVVCPECEDCKCKGEELVELIRATAD